MPRTYFDDSRFQDALVALLVRDHTFLRTCGHVIEAKDFRPKSGSNDAGHDRWVIAQLALQHFTKYRAPIRDLLPVEVEKFCEESRVGAKGSADLSRYALRLLKKKVLSVESVADKVLEFKRQKQKAKIVEEMIDAQARGELTDDLWFELSRQGVEAMSENSYYVADYFAELEKRMTRRSFKLTNRFPCLMIEDLDLQTRAIARGHLGLVIAPYKRGKSLCLIHITTAYVLQRLNVLFITLEDPVEDVEDRFDASVSAIPIKELSDRPRRLRSRFNSFLRMVRARLFVVDGTEQRFSVARIETVWEELRNKGFTADAIIIDYDDEIVPSRKQRERRLEFAEIYRDLRLLASKKNVIIWTAAQTQRATSDNKILTGDQLAEDVSKVRKVTMALSLGSGDWGEGSIYLCVVAHKFDRQMTGCNVMSDKPSMLIYSRELTLKKKAEMRAREASKEDEYELHDQEAE